ncbi:hypothetical protein [Ornithinibacillus halophilus]|uniref:Uncharacterized protein n=1 Tax=Ornithinibacillus halophilus TaxID=930117 RepID=A0A1M5G3M6_9BACI|nr:hypothetical protein [Ornithinibacillus halophilus]SHF98032.1 hypothetical protein SAMN05216225_101141 [Ornithinibacillus halophilus]
MVIRIPVNQQMINDCFNFATTIINGNNQYNRIPTTASTRIERTFVGKLAELAFLNYLNNNGKNYPMGTMFQIFQGQQNTDGYDFITRIGQESVDVKSASKPNHSRIMIPIDQFQNIPKDYYVGVRINAEVDNNNNILINTINSADIFGYCTYQELADNPTEDFGYPCKAMYLNQLTDIQQLLNKF